MSKQLYTDLRTCEIIEVDFEGTDENKPDWLIETETEHGLDIE